MATQLLQEDREYQSGECVEPGTYIDVETGAIVKVQEADELPEGNRLIRYRRRFRRIDPEALAQSKRVRS